jgi:hypothetical protein
VRTTTATEAAHRRVRPVTTPRRLRRWLGALLLLTGALGASTSWAFATTQDTAAALRTRSAPTIVHLTAAYDALVQADVAALADYRRAADPAAPALVDLGPDFQDPIAIASQKLTLIATENTVGSRARASLQLVQGLLVTYTALIGRADVHWQRGEPALVAADLSDAYRLLHGDGGILALLAGILDDQRGIVRAQVPSHAVNVLVIVVLTILAVASVAAVAASVLFHRRFRRRFNPGLVVAVVLLTAGLGLIYQVHAAMDGTESTRDGLDRLVDRWHSAVLATGVQEQNNLREMLTASCSTCAYGSTLTGMLTVCRPATGPAGGLRADRRRHRRAEPGGEP